MEFVGRLFAPVGALFSSMASKVMLGLIIALAVLAFFFYKSSESKTEDLNKATVELATTKGSLENANATIKTMTESKKIDGDTRENIVKQDTVYRERIVNLESTIEKQVAAVIAKYDQAPKTPEAQAAKDKEVSAVRIAGTWDIFCATNAAHPDCATAEVKK